MVPKADVLNCVSDSKNFSFRVAFCNWPHLYLNFQSKDTQKIN